MRGGRNKLGTYYKQDRANRKLFHHHNGATAHAAGIGHAQQQENLLLYEPGGGLSSVCEANGNRFSSSEADDAGGGPTAKRRTMSASSLHSQQLQHHHLNNQQQFSASGYFGLSKGQHEQQQLSSSGFDMYLQSPTLSSSSNSTNSSTNGIFGDLLMHRPQHAVPQMPNGDSLAMLLSNSIQPLDSGMMGTNSQTMMAPLLLQHHHHQQQIQQNPLHQLPYGHHQPGGVHIHQQQQQQQQQFAMAVASSANSSSSSSNSSSGVGSELSSPPLIASSTSLPATSSASMVPPYGGTAASVSVHNHHNSHQNALPMVKKEKLVSSHQPPSFESIPAAATVPSIYHQTAAVTYTPIMPNTPTLHMTTSLHVTTPVHPSYLFPPAPHHHNHNPHQHHLHTNQHLTAQNGHAQQNLLHAQQQFNQHPHHHHQPSSASAAATASPSSGSSVGSQQQQLLPLCPIPTIDGVFYGGANGNGGGANGNNANERHFLEELYLSMVDKRPSLSSLQKAMNEMCGEKVQLLDFCALVATHNLKTNIKWAREDVYFAQLDRYCRSVNFIAAWAILHLIDFAYGVKSAQLPFQVNVGTDKEAVEMSSIALLGCDQFHAEWNELLMQLRQYHFDEYDYVAFKYLTLLDYNVFQRPPYDVPKFAQFHAQLYQVYSQVLHSWSELRNYNGVMVTTVLLDILQKFSQLASKCVEHLSKKAQSEKLKLPNLLEEMLGKASSDEAAMAEKGAIKSEGGAGGLNFYAA